MVRAADIRRTAAPGFAAAARSASRSLTGAFSHEIHALRDALIHLRMLVEATLDFPEEEIDFLDKADARGQLAGIRQALADTLARARQGALLREGLQVVLAGQPNVGKSSLLNALAGAELAIVTAIPGTTRDKVSQTIQIEGVPLHIVDTAGLRDDEDAADEVERIGIGRSWAAIAEADAGERFDRLLCGRPVHFHSTDSARDKQAEADLRACCLAAGFAEVDFRFEPEGAALAIAPNDKMILAGGRAAGAASETRIIDLRCVSDCGSQVQILGDAPIASIARRARAFAVTNGAVLVGDDVSGSWVRAYALGDGAALSRLSERMADVLPSLVEADQDQRLPGNAASGHRSAQGLGVQDAALVP